MKKQKSESFYLNIQWETFVGDRKARYWAIHKGLSLSRQKGRERERERDFEKKDSVLQVNWDQFREPWAELGHVVEFPSPAQSPRNHQTKDGPAQLCKVEVDPKFLFYFYLAKMQKTPPRFCVSCKNTV